MCASCSSQPFLHLAISLKCTDWIQMSFEKVLPSLHLPLGQIINPKCKHQSSKLLIRIWENKGKVHQNRCIFFLMKYCLLIKLSLSVCGCPHVCMDVCKQVCVFRHYSVNMHEQGGGLEFQKNPSGCKEHHSCCTRNARHGELKPGLKMALPLMVLKYKINNFLTALNCALRNDFGIELSWKSYLYGKWNQVINSGTVERRICTSG